ncbi:hemolysin A [Brucella vulpis]|nr:hemolysin A [Brucella vulpis]CUW50140.1 hemolysin A [Brucella vulpis]
MNGQSTDNRPRLDQLLVERGFFATRSRARDAIQRGTVKVDGRPITKPGQMVARDAALAVDDPASAYVSRAALKLVAALDHFGLDVKGADRARYRCFYRRFHASDAGAERASCHRHRCWP